MTGVSSDPGRRAGPAAAARVLVVAGLVGLAATGLSARRGLDWQALSATPDSVWPRLLLGVVAGSVLVYVARHLFMRWSRATRPGGPEGEAPRLPWQTLLILLPLALLAIYLTILASRSSFHTTIGDERAQQSQPAETHLGTGNVDWPLLAGLALALVGSYLFYLRSRRPAPPGPMEPESEQEQTEALADAVAQAGTALGRHDDTREAIIAAYTAMERAFAAGLARRGGRPRPSDTPAEVLDRAVATGLVGAGPAGRLTDLFREARFSRHPMGPAARRDAEGALAEVSAQLGGQRV
jgi:NADH:ubiquinone oxidoreductase subunit 5 (subunit L)/multisubunit Na+/H+ antiporter MnhA subunit